jgi:putative aldouronate transport system permease protein
MTNLPERTIKPKNNYFRRTWMLYLMLLLPMVFFVIFRYVPMINIVIAFKDYNMFRGVWDSPWVGFHWFKEAFKLPGAWQFGDSLKVLFDLLGSSDFYRALGNTLLLNFLDLIMGFPAPIILAIILNELSFNKYKKLTQTVVYLPHFLSWIIIAGIAKQLFAPSGGVINIMITRLGGEPIDFLMSNGLWVGTYIGLGVWKEMGWGTIIYLAAITGINPELYEAAEVDGAGRLRKIWHITLPGIRSTIVILLIMNLGRILGSEFDRPYTLANPTVMKVADVISTLVYRVGIRSNQFSYTAAIGLFQSIICVLFLVMANTIAKKSGERGIY